MFQCDPAKNISNAARHGIDFEEAQRLWRNEKLAILEVRTDHEDRAITLGGIDDRHWSAVFTKRGDRIRPISARRSRPVEIEHYEVQ